MSRFVQALERLNKESGTAASSFGFVRSAAKQERAAVMVLLAISGQAEHAAAIAKQSDGFLVRPAGRTAETAVTKAFADGAPQGAWGMQVSKLSPEQAMSLKKQGCDFVALASAAIPLDGLKENELGRILLVSNDQDREQARVFSAMPLDAVLLAEPLTLPLTLQQLVEAATLRSWFTKPMLVTLAGVPSQWELECLRDIGMSGIGLQVDQAGLPALEAFHRAVRQLGPRRMPKGDRTIALVPSMQVGAGPGQRPEPPDPDREDDDDEP